MNLNTFVISLRVYFERAASQIAVWCRCYAPKITIIDFFYKWFRSSGAIHSDFLCTKVQGTDTIKTFRAIICDAPFERDEEVIFYVNFFL